MHACIQTYIHAYIQVIETLVAMLCTRKSHIALINMAGLHDMRYHDVLSAKQDLENAKTAANPKEKDSSGQNIGGNRHVDQHDDDDDANINNNDYNSSGQNIGGSNRHVGKHDMYLYGDDEDVNSSNNNNIYNSSGQNIGSGSKQDRNLDNTMDIQMYDHAKSRNGSEKHVTVSESENTRKNQQQEGVGRGDVRHGLSETTIMCVPEPELKRVAVNMLVKLVRHGHRRVADCLVQCLCYEHDTHVRK
jgi:hypothetical protein